MHDLISRQAAIDAINQICPIDTEYDCTLLDRVDVRCVLTDLPSAQPERMTNRQWVDFLSAQFDISRTSAKEMLHGMMRWKKEDNFKRQFSQGKSDLVKDLVNEQTEREGE